MRIGEFLLSKAVHAKTPAIEISWRRVVGIQIDRAQNATMDDIALAVDLDFGATTIETGDASLRLSLKSAYLQLELDNASIDLTSKYVERFADGHVAATEQKTSEKGSTVDLATGATGDQDGVMARAAATFGWRSNKTAKSDTNVTRRINLVTPSGQDGWWLGPEGDARMLAGDLEGQVLYWNHGEMVKPLCRLRANDSSTPVTARLRVQVQISHFRISAREDAVRDDMAKALTADRSDIVKRMKAAEAELRSRVAAMAMLLPNLSEADPGYFDIASRTVRFVPEEKAV